MPDNPMIALAEEAAERLQGTGQSLADLGEQFEDASKDKAFTARLDELVFECETCNWWCEISEMAEGEDWVCDECSDTND